MKQKVDTLNEYLKKNQNAKKYIQLPRIVKFSIKVEHLETYRLLSFFIHKLKYSSYTLFCLFVLITNTLVDVK